MSTTLPFLVENLFLITTLVQPPPCQVHHGQYQCEQWYHHHHKATVGSHYSDTGGLEADWRRDKLFLPKYGNSK